MKISEWFKNGCDYEEGVAIYASLQKSNHNLVRLFKRKYSISNSNKLKYELSKYKEIEVKQTIIIPKGEKVNPQVDLSTAAPSQPPSPSVKEYRILRLNELPVELHERYIKQKNDFYKACSIKIKLNNLPAEDETQALEYCLEIERLFDSIEKSWKVFDHYKEFKVVPAVTSVDKFSTLTPVLLLKAEKAKREAISKAKARIKVLTLHLAAVIPTKVGTSNSQQKNNHSKLTRQLQSKKEALIGHEADLEQIKELINRK